MELKQLLSTCLKLQRLYQDHQHVSTTFDKSTGEIVGFFYSLQIEVKITERVDKGKFYYIIFIENLNIHCIIK